MPEQYSYQLSSARNAFGLALFGLLTLLASGYAVTNREPLHLFTALDFTAPQASLPTQHWPCFFWRRRSPA